MSTPEQRKALRRYWEERERVFAEYRAADAAYDAAFDEWCKFPRLPRPARPMMRAAPDFPEECRNMTCGAKTRQGHPCRQTDLYPNGRCKFHGGASTGPTTAKGKRRSALNGLQRKAKPMER